jgi:hypothetical protein
MTNVDSAASSSAGLGSTVTSMARQQQRVMANIDSTMSSPAGLGSVVTSTSQQRHCATAKLTQQLHHQHESTTTLRHDQRHLGSVVTNMTWGFSAYFPTSNPTRGITAN